MKDADLDSILSHEPTIHPSSGFVSSVIEAVYREAAAPAPLPFPWKWAAPGLLACLGLLGTLIALTVGSSSLLPSDLSQSRLDRSDWAQLGEALSNALAPDHLLVRLHQLFVGSGLTAAAGWIVVALLLTLIPTLLSLRMAGGED